MNRLSTEKQNNNRNGGKAFWGEESPREGVEAQGANCAQGRLRNGMRTEPRGEDSKGIEASQPGPRCWRG